MNLEEYQVLFTVGTLALVLLAASPTLGLIVSIPEGTQRFSELWVLDPNHMMEEYPFNVQVNGTYTIFVGVGNRMGVSSYYMVYVKFRNQTQPLPGSLNSIPSPLNSTYEFQFFLADGETWEIPLIFSFQGKPMFVSDILVNDVVFPVNCPSTWDSDRNGFYYQLFFELWIYNMTSQSFQFHNRFVGIWLNMTARV